MSTNPKAGVVDSQWRVHGIDNLYLAGCYVFPTTGYENPTLTVDGSGSCLTPRCASMGRTQVATASQFTD